MFKLRVNTRKRFQKLAHICSHVYLLVLVFRIVQESEAEQNSKEIELDRCSFLNGIALNSLTDFQESHVKMFIQCGCLYLESQFRG